MDNDELIVLSSDLEVTDIDSQSELESIDDGGAESKLPDVEDITTDLTRSDESGSETDSTTSSSGLKSKKPR